MNWKKNKPNTNHEKIYPHNSNVVLSFGFVSGEVKLALTLRLLLTGGTYMDLALLYEVGMTYAYKILHGVVCN